MNILKNKTTIFFLVALFILTLGTIFLSIGFGNERRLERLQKQLDQCVYQARTEQNLLSQYLEKKENLSLQLISTSTNHTTFVFLEDSVIYWSNNLIDIVQIGEIDSEPIKITDKHGRKYLIISKEVLIANNRYLIKSAILLFSKNIYNSATEFEGPNPLVFKNDKFYLGSVSEESAHLLKLGEEQFIPIYFKNSLNSTIKMLLIFGGFLIFPVLIIVLIFNRKHGEYTIFYFLLGYATLIIYRAILLFMDFPSILGDYILFNSNLFASSWINPSLGDLLINVVLLLLGSFLVYKASKMYINSTKKRQIILFYILCLVAQILFYIFYINVYIV